MKYKCLILDHDDTVVNSTATVHYPCFVEYTQKFFPDVHMSLEEYFLKNFDPGIVKLFTEIVGMSEEQMRDEQKYWNAYVKQHIPEVYPEMYTLIKEQKSAGGLVCVVSWSLEENIRRDYRENGLPEPDMVYGWDLPKELRKPSSWPVEQIMQRTGLPAEDILVIDDLKPGYDMASAAGVPFAAAGWANDIPEIEQFMRANCGLYFKTAKELREYLK